MPKSGILNPAFARQEQIRATRSRSRISLLVCRDEHVQVWSANRHHLGQRETTLGALLQHGLEAAAIEQLHDEIDLALLRFVVVEHQHHAGMRHLVRGVALAQEATSGSWGDRVLGMEDLDRRAHAVAMCGCVDGGHAADAEQRVEVPLPT